MKRIIALFFGYLLVIVVALAVYAGAFLAMYRGKQLDPMAFPVVMIFLMTGMAPLAILLPAVDFLILRRSWPTVSVMRLLLLAVPVLIITPFAVLALELLQSRMVALTILPLVNHAILVRSLRTMICPIT